MTTPACQQPPCVAVVDDHVRLLEHLTELLPEFGVEVAATAERGEETVAAIAAAIARGIQVSVVIMDVHMPGIGGLEATRQVRAAFPYVQVVLHTAYGGHLEQQRSQVGAFAEVAKGTHPLELVHTIQRAHQLAFLIQTAAVS